MIEVNEHIKLKSDGEIEYTQILILQKINYDSFRDKKQKKKKQLTKHREKYKENNFCPVLVIHGRSVWVENIRF